MILSLHCLTFLSLLSCYLALNLFGKFMPRIQPRLAYSSQSNIIYQNYVPLYRKTGPNPVTDCMGNHFQPRYLVKRFHRTKRQVTEDDHQFQDLLDSFGGNPESNNIEVTTEAATQTETDQNIETSTARTGFYFLLDWKSFFVLDDQNGRKVNLRFQPKVGDPKRFYSVTVP